MSVNEKKATYIHQLSAEEKEYALRLFDEVRLLGHEDSLTWQLESIKHLAVINGAGLAASIAAAGVWVSNETIRRAAVEGCALCVVGLSIAVALMVWRWIWGTKQARMILIFRVNFVNGKVPLEDFDSLVVAKRVRIFAWGSAVFALILFLVAMLHLVVKVLCS
jgi:hypothetical protein